MTTEHEFSTIRVADLIDYLTEAVDAARVAATGNRRWLTAIDAAWDHLLQAETVEYRHWDHALSYYSESGKLYLANGRCQCEAYRSGNACKHRAAARLVFRAVELRQQAEHTALAQELIAEARAAGCAWYGAAEALEGARARMDGVMDFAAEWDAESERQRAALSARIGAAQARMMAQAA